MTAAQATTYGTRILYLLNNYGSSFLRGAGTTILIALVGTAVGCLIGFAVGIVQTIPATPKDSLPKKILLRVVKFLMALYVEVFRGTPMMVQAMFIFYGFAQYAKIHMGMWTAAFVILSIHTGAYMAETVRGGILSIDPGQMEAAKAIGMTHAQAMTSVIFPQAFRNIIPQIGNNFIINIKDTAVLSVISVTDLFFEYKSAAGALYTYFESASIVMLIYLVMTVTSSALLRLLENKLDGDDSYDLNTTDTLAYTSGLLSYRPKKQAEKFSPKEAENK